MIRVSAIVAAFFIALAPLPAAAQAPEQNLEQAELPPELQRWPDIMRLVVQRIAYDQGVYSLPENEAEAAEMRQRVAASRAEFEAAIAVVAAAAEANRETTPEELAAQQRALARVNELARFVETTRLGAIAGEIDIDIANRTTMLAIFRDVNLISGEMARAIENYLAPGSFEFAWNRAFEITQRVGALDMETRIQILRGAPGAAARQAMAVLADQTRALAPMFAELATLDAERRVSLSETTLRHADALEAHAASLSARTPDSIMNEVAGDPPALITDLANIAPPPAAPL